MHYDDYIIRDVKNPEKIRINDYGIRFFGPRFAQAGIDIAKIQTYQELERGYEISRQFVFSGAREAALNIQAGATTEADKDFMQIMIDILEGDHEAARAGLNEIDRKNMRSEQKAQLRIV